MSRVQNATNVSGTGHITHPNPALHSYVISRRPQRLFHFAPSQHGRCDISWQMGVVVTVSKGTISIFSVERDERLKAFDFSCRSDEEIYSPSSSSFPIFSASEDPFSSSSSAASAAVSRQAEVIGTVDLLGMDDIDDDRQKQQQSQPAMSSTAGATTGGNGTGTTSLPASPTRPSTTAATATTTNKFNFGRKSKGLCCGLRYISTPTLSRARPS